MALTQHRCRIRYRIFHSALRRFAFSPLRRLPVLWDGLRGSMLAVRELSRLGRSMHDCTEIVSIASDAGIRVRALKGVRRLDGITVMVFPIATETGHGLIPCGRLRPRRALCGGGYWGASRAAVVQESKMRSGRERPLVLRSGGRRGASSTNSVQSSRYWLPTAKRNVSSLGAASPRRLTLRTGSGSAASRNREHGIFRRIRHHCWVWAEIGIQ